MGGYNSPKVRKPYKHLSQRVHQRFAGITLALLWLVAPAGAAVLAWDMPPETNVIGYVLLGGSTTNALTLTNNVSGRTNTTATITNVPIGKSVWIALAIADDGTVSDPSNPVTLTNRAFPPRNFRLVSMVQVAGDVTGPWTNLASVIIPMPVADRAQFFRPRLLLEEVP
jgi:hypothetical protein